MKIALYSPYIPEHLGGGETYLMRVAAVLSQEHQVVVAVSESAVDSDSLKQKYSDFTHFDLSKVEFVSSPLRHGSMLQKLAWTRQFDVVYYVTDGSFFLSAAKRNIVHIQIPFTNTLEQPLDRLKLANWSIRNTNSFFTQSVVTKAWRTEVQFVHQPAIDVAAFTSSTVKKQPLILHVGRFFRQLHSKRQDVLVELFRKLVTQHPSVKGKWRLVLVGTVEDAGYAAEVAKVAKGLPIDIKHQVSRAELIELYQQASMYWHATGYGVDASQYPEKMEHFGISTVEAMAAGAVPVVYAQGGQPEVLGESLQQWGWQNLEEALDKTWQLISQPSVLQTAQQRARDRAQHFDGQRFAQILKEMIHA